MKHVRLRIDAGDAAADVHPMVDLLVNAPFVESVSTTHWNNAGGTLGIMHYVEGDPAAFEEAVADTAMVRSFDLTEVDDGSFYAYLRCETTRLAVQLWAAFTYGDLVVVPPIEWGDGATATVSIVGDSAELQTAIDTVPEPLDVDVESIGGVESLAPAGILTDRQHEALEAASELGYYDVPREADHEDVAAAIDCSPSTASEHLRKAEAVLVRSALGK